MKTTYLLGALLLTFFTGDAFAQHVFKSKVPSLVSTSFKQQFPSANDIEWEMDGHNYKVEFEVGSSGADHEAWYDNAGTMLRHTEELSKDGLPPAVMNKIKSDFKGYTIEDPMKITEGTRVTYELELEKMVEEWKVTFDEAGNMISKVAD
jgi:hypothetical protein